MPRQTCPHLAGIRGRGHPHLVWPACRFSVPGVSQCERLLGATGILCWMLAVCVLGSAAVPEPTGLLITRNLELTTFLKNGSTLLHKIYLQQMGSPFSDPDFSPTGRHLEGVADAAIPYWAWWNLSTQERLGADLGALSTLLKLLGVMVEDLRVLGDSSSPPGQLLGQLNAHRFNVRDLVTGLSNLLSALGHPPPTLPLPLATPSSEISAFERKVRGYLICQTYMGWLVRTERDLKLLSHSVSAL